MEKKLKFLRQLDVVIATTLMLVVFIVVMLQIISRLTPGNAISWTVEMGEILLAGVIWMGVGLGVLNNSHVRLDLLLTKLPFKAKKVFYIIGNMLFVLFLLILAYYTIELLTFYINSNTRTPSLRWNKAIIRAPVLIGCVIGVVRMSLQAWLFATEAIPLPTVDNEIAEAVAQATSDDAMRKA
jgi:TRAP-type C4-dicarboxylate transport system permease small subunit